MINKIGVENSTAGINSSSTRQQKEGIKQNPNFKGLGAIALAGIQKCEQVPMINVAVIDMLSAILPRTIVESMTNWFAGFEAFRRESSGLIVNCLIPSFITLGIAKLLNPAFLPKGVNMSRSWASVDMIQKASEYYKEASSKDKVKESLKKLIENIEGVDGDKHRKFAEILKEDTENYAKQLADISRKDIKNYEMRKEVGKVTDEIIKRTKIAENITVEKINAQSVNSMLEDAVKFFREFQRTDGKMNIDEFAKINKKFVRTKSLLGLAVVLPLAASMQYINRWITGKVSGTKGAPIYDDFAKGKENIEENPKAKEGLLRQKLISISSMVAVSLLSLTKMPNMKMLDFKGMFPTMDQARIISTTTFASRMAAADDKNELAEATVRDIATFASLYYLGDVAAKGAATIIQNKTGVKLLNDMKPLEGNEGFWKRFKHWMKDVNVKSSNEVISKTEEALKGAKPTKEQAEIIKKELEKAVNYRSYCQVTNLGVSLALLGLIIPIFTRRNTKRKHEQALKLAQEQNNTQTENKQNEEKVTPLNVQYSKLTAGFRAENKQKTA